VYHNDQELIFYNPKRNDIMIAPGDINSHFNKWLKLNGYIIIGVV
jgi:hypothetical protein